MFDKKLLLQHIENRPKTMEEQIGDAMLNDAIKKDAERYGYDPKKAEEKFYDRPVAVTKGMIGSALTLGAVKPSTLTDLYMKKARTGRVNRQRIYSMLKGKPKESTNQETHHV